MKFNRSLLIPLDESGPISDGLRSCTNAHGLYSTLHFVLRLSPEVHRKLASAPSGIHNFNQLSFDQVQAFSTYLHETIHWWQHIGSSAGLMLSLSHPIQSHCNYTELKTFLRGIGPKKSILKYTLNAPLGASGVGSTAATVVVNNYKDLKFFQSIALAPKYLPKLVEDPHFESVGHSYFIMCAYTLRELSGLFDPEHRILPDSRKWGPAFRKLAEDKVEGFYHGSPICIPPLGLREIFEGQARFIQLQYLHFGSGGRFGWDDARDLGMFGEVYVAAFKIFLEHTESEWPGEIGSPLVALFLAVCDVAINCGEGFPLPLRSPSTFISDIDPGTRFLFLCRVIALNARHLKEVAKAYSRDEYVEITEELCKLLVTPSPLKIAQSVAGWSQTHEPLVRLMEEDRVFRFTAEDMPARLLFARYIGFNRDKAVRPQMFCWPGAWLAGTRTSVEGEALFDRHRALFVDKEDDDGIFPIIMPDKDPRAVQETFNSFYAWIVSYDMISQWISRDGPFEYDYGWLSTVHQTAETRDWAAGGFERLFGIHPDKFEIM